MSYFTIKSSFWLVPSYRCDEEFRKIDKFMEFLEKSGVGKIVESVKTKDKQCKGRKGYNPYNLFAMIIYCFAKFKASLRDIEDKCIFDLRVLYIMEGNIPDHSVIGDFINEYIIPYQYEIFTTITKQIIKDFNLTIEDIFVDGTKLEANADKYKFVWKPTKYHTRLDIKIKELLKEMGYVPNSNKLIKAEELNKLLKDYASINQIEIPIPTSRGKRLSKEQKNYKLAYQYLTKLLEYEEKERICGKNRNSYYKTDKDATAMVLKKDYYSKLSHDFHAGYNVQVLVSNLLILMYGVFQDRTDYYTFIPMNNLYFKYYQRHPKNICADSEYGIHINYKYLREHHIGNYVKFQTWSGEASGKSPQLFYTFNDGVMCLDTCIGKEIPFNQNYHQRNKEGKLFKFIGCNNCKYAYKCKAKLKRKYYDYINIELITDYELLKEEARNNLQSPKGIEMRINRSIQAEGTFGQIKNNMNYDRIRRRGLENVSVEIMLRCLGVNLRKYFLSLDDNKFKNNYWKIPTTLHKEIFPSVKPKEKRLSRN